MKSLAPLALLLLTSTSAFCQTATNKTKMDDDPTKIITKIGVSWADNYDFDDSNVAISGSLAIDEARKLNARVNSDGSEWRVGGSWLFPIGIFNFNFGKNQYTNGSTQTNYSVGTFIPLSYFGIEPAGIQIFPMTGYTYNTGNHLTCDTSSTSRCNNSDFSDEPSPENGFVSTSVSGSSGYLGLFAIKALTQNLRLLSFAGGSLGSKNDRGDYYRGIFGGFGLGYSITPHHSIKAMTFIMNNNTYLDSADTRVLLAYTYQFN
ncbi:MAG: hypothetical protein ACRDC6_10270 [Shewanella sp.]